MKKVKYDKKYITRVQINKIMHIWKISKGDLFVKFFIFKNLVRLVDGINSNEGRVEIFYKGLWGTVCDDSWGADDATVVCRQLGLPYTNATARGDAAFGEGAGVLWLDDVACSGTENWLDECLHNGWGSHDCTHAEDAGVICGMWCCRCYKHIHNKIYRASFQACRERRLHTLQ